MDATTLPLGILGVKHLAEAIDGHLSLALTHKHDHDRVEEELCAAERLARKVEQALHCLRVINQDAVCAEQDAAFVQRCRPTRQPNVVTLGVAANEGAA